MLGEGLSYAYGNALSTWSERWRASLFEIRVKVFRNLGQKSGWKYSIMLKGVVCRLICM